MTSLTRRMWSCLYAGVCLILSPVSWADGAASETTGKPVAGSIEAMLDGQRVVLAALTSHYQVSIEGDVANVEVTQTFENHYAQALNARYLFPLNRHAAVHAMTMRVGDEVVSAEIQEIRQARQTFARAKADGKTATLLEQYRPNMFTQNIANLMPGVPIEVVIEYAQVVPRVDDAYELVVPMVVGPRFQPAGAGVVPAATMGAAGTPEPATGATLSTVSNTGVAKAGAWVLEQLPDYPAAAGVHMPREMVPERVSLHIDLESPVPLQSVTSATHPLTVRDISSTLQEIQFAQGEVLDNKDFVLRYVLAGQATNAGLLSHWEPLEGGYFNLLIEPPLDVPENAALAREMVFLLDCSGSMSGRPMNASKRFMQQALQVLRPADSFRIIRFSDSATEFSRRALPATQANIEAGIRYTKNLYGSGGTMMTSGVRQALTGLVPAGTVRNVIFLTDGYIGNEVSVLQLVNDLRGDARLYAFGVGAGVNRFLLSELSRVGRGFTRYFDPTRDDESIAAVAAELVAKLQTPVLTDLRIDWGGLPVRNVVPAQLPDLYAGDSIRVTGRFSRQANGEVTISGHGRGHQASISRVVKLDDSNTRPAVRRVWARTAISEHMHNFITPPGLREDRMSNDQLQAAVTDLGLIYALATRWTAFVAVSRKVYNLDPGSNAQADVPVPRVAGVSNSAYSQPAMTGHGAPEPGMFLSLLVALLSLAALRRYWRLIPG